jgi:hypothetical protein
VRQKLLNLGLRNRETSEPLGPGGSVVRPERNETRFVLAKVKSQSRPASGESPSWTQVSWSDDHRPASLEPSLPGSYNSMQSVI